MSKRAVRIILVVFLFSLLYSVVRYHLFEGVPFKDFPLYVLNKGIALAAFILLTLNFSLGPARALGFEVSDSWLGIRKEIGIGSFVMVLAHVLISVLVFGSGGYYDKLSSENGGLSAIGSWSLLLGVLSFVWLWFYNISLRTLDETESAVLAPIASKGSLTLLGFMSAGHVGVIGFEGWLLPGSWAGGMPPITLVAFAVSMVGVAINLLARR